MKDLYVADLVFVDGKFHEGMGVLVDGGEIVKVASLDQIDRDDCVDTVLSDRALFPGTVNAHNHSFQSLVRGLGDDLSFFDWRDHGIYKYSLNLGPDDVYTGALFAFGEMLTYGVTTVADFFYLHAGGNENARAVIRAAHKLGIRLVLARTMYDWEQGPRVCRETVKQAAKNTRALFREFKDDPMVSVCPAPHSPHAASPEMIQAGAELAAELETPMHIHVAEGQYEVEMIQDQHGCRPFEYLDRLDALGPVTLAVHCVWLNDEELDLMAARDVKLAYNPASNMFLADGVARVKEMLDRGITVGLGTDGACSNNRTSIFDEMRTCCLLQKIHYLDSTACTAEDALAMGTVNGGEALGLKVGKIAAGYRADFTVLDLTHLSLHPAARLEKNLVYALSPEAITRVIVDGKPVYGDGELTNISKFEILERVTSLTRGW